MARHTTTFVVPDEGRDQGKRFLITEMSATQAEDWALRVLLALLSSNPEIPEDFATLGMAGLAEMGLKSLGAIKHETLKPLLKEMLDCVQIQPGPNKAHVLRPIIEDDIEEVMTLLSLRKEVWDLHTGFLQAVAPSILGQKATANPGPQRVTPTSRK